MAKKTSNSCSQSMTGCDYFLRIIRTDGNIWKATPVDTRKRNETTRLNLIPFQTIETNENENEIKM